jgi:hypothetical protein
MFLVYSSNIEWKEGKGKWKVESGKREMEREPRRGDILIGGTLMHYRIAPGMEAASFWGMEKGRSMLRPDGMNQKIQWTAR